MPVHACQVAQLDTSLSSCTAPPWRRHGSSSPLSLLSAALPPSACRVGFCLTTESSHTCGCRRCSLRVARCVLLVACRGRAQGRFLKRWFVIKDSFLLCYNSREDMNNPQDGHKTGRRFVLPLMGMLLLLSHICLWPCAHVWHRLRCEAAARRRRHVIARNTSSTCCISLSAHRALPSSEECTLL
jgi:hypothetical protein